MLDDEYEQKIKHCAVIAKPLASQKLCKKVLKLCKKATKKKQVKRGVKEVVKAIRKKQTGLVFFAGDISPIDVISHVPVLCEDNNIPYVYVPSKEDLASAGQTKRPTSCLMVLSKPIKSGEQEDADLTELITDVSGRLQKLAEAQVEECRYSTDAECRLMQCPKAAQFCCSIQSVGVGIASNAISTREPP
eukprot:TRINITY_DN6937_c0_g1_i5.p1 TRINITY_DN6937_c0_g1~~TRINITY_DN6937_c0_g1_i5.p1  ORF type:complete len:190 (+),score=23.43 TRINITY_DN6937_c0_g1_i5:344-913(+)